LWYSNTMFLSTTSWDSLQEWTPNSNSNCHSDVIFFPYYGNMWRSRGWWIS
jgi:hypothetical protein